ncbi:MAG TPA: GAP family protein [Luteimicrobium sp.]|nr:GAP family protein [Luteimicrobium sp.]
MGAAIGQSLPVAVGVLVSPLPIVAVVLMLVTPRAKANALSFLLGWLVGIYVLGAIVILVAGAATPSDDKPAWVAWVKIVLGVLLLLVAVRQWRGRPRGDAEPPTPKWMSAIDTFKPPAAFGLAVLLGAVNPKNLLLVVSGAAAIAAAAPGDTGTQLVALVVFTVVAALGVATPIVVYLAMGKRAATILDELKTWMIHNNAVIMAVLLLVIGMKMIGDGITAI